MVQVVRDKDVIWEAIVGRTVAMIGFGSQGAAQAQNLRDSGAMVRVGVREGKSADAARSLGFAVSGVSEAVQGAEFIVMALPDVEMGRIYREAIGGVLSGGACLVFSHGFAVHYGLLEPLVNIDVVLAAPMGAGPIVRRRFEEGSGVPGLAAVAQDATGKAWPRAHAYAAAIGCGRTAILETTFREETESDLFGEQVVLCGGLPELIRAAYDTAVAGGISPEIAYIACLHEMKLIADLIFDQGLDGMLDKISGTAEWGGFEVGPRVIGADSRAAIWDALRAIQSGEFAKNWSREWDSGGRELARRHEKALNHPIHEVGKRVRAVFRGEI